MTQIQTHDRQPIVGVKDMLAVSSGKGGVGKSTISTNLAVAMAMRGRRIGLMDADVYGPNIPGMLGLEGKPTVDEASGSLQPPEAFGLKVISMGMLVDPGVPVIWRGPMLAKMMHQFLFQVNWGELDVLVVDLPPGTGDVQISLTQTAPLSGAAIVTTPSAIAVEDVRRGVQMFRQTEVPILGLIENMSTFVCHACEKESAIFGEGGGLEVSRQFEIPFTGQIPLDPRLRASADAGTPIVSVDPQLPASRSLMEIADRLLEALDAREEGTD